jgi:hypothetical protein
MCIAIREKEGQPEMPEKQEASVISESVFTDHLVLYMDFLGVSEAATLWSEDRAASLIGLLTTIAEEKIEFSIDGASQTDGSYKFKITPETATFSDHIVASYRINWQDNEHLNTMIVEMYLKVAQDLVISIARRALDIGMLVRGGVTIGKLYHLGGVVFGEALVDAYHLESRVAIYPRIAVSSRIYSRLPNRDRIAQDTDGIWYLKYLSELSREIPEGDRASWFKGCCEMIQGHVNNFEQQDKWNEFAKWSWFGQKFSDEVRI